LRLFSRKNGFPAVMSCAATPKLAPPGIEVPVMCPGPSASWVSVVPSTTANFQCEPNAGIVMSANG